MFVIEKRCRNNQLKYYVQDLNGKKKPISHLELRFIVKSGEPVIIKKSKGETFKSGLSVQIMQ